MTESFYKDLHRYGSLEEVTAGVEPEPLPDDWWVIVADVMGSTEAIEKGEYKAVNTVGAATIVAIVNVDRSIPIPYIFGGDGATLAVPPRFELQARRALLGSRDLARDGFGLNLRTGMVQVGDLVAKGHRVGLVKYKLSEHMDQPAFFGRGWDVAEEMLKNPGAGEGIEIHESAEIFPEADFTGFECRWQGIPARHDHKLSILVLCVLKDPADHPRIYTAVSKKIADLYGLDHHPIEMEGLTLASRFKEMAKEAIVRTNPGQWLDRFLYSCKLAFNLLAGRFIFARGIDTEAVEWSRYRQDLIANTDYKKFDGMLKMVVDGTEAQRQELEAFLKEMQDREELVYGLHTSKDALLTCLIFDYNQDHIHFLDGGDGGYAIAAKQLKQALKEFKASH